MRDIYLKIKWAYQRVVRGYDDRFMWSMDYYLTGTFLEAIEEFCQLQLANESFVKLNKKKANIYKATLVLISEVLEGQETDFDGKLMTKFWSYFGKNIGNFWD